MSAYSRLLLLSLSMLDYTAFGDLDSIARTGRVPGLEPGEERKARKMLVGRGFYDHAPQISPVLRCSGMYVSLFEQLGLGRH